YIDEEYMSVGSAYVGLALPGDAGSWQNESKGYQFWTMTDEDGISPLEIYEQEIIIFMLGFQFYWRLKAVQIGGQVHRYSSILIWSTQSVLVTIEKTGSLHRKKDNKTYLGTTWQVRVNDPKADLLFSSGVIGKAISIARHGIYGLYWLYTVNVPGRNMRHFLIGRPSSSSTVFTKIPFRFKR
ncbi:hypothetical protein FRX31_033131, partial [Thalictrum thalictroides]